MKIVSQDRSYLTLLCLDTVLIIQLLSQHGYRINDFIVFVHLSDGPTNRLPLSHLLVTIQSELLKVAMITLSLLNNTLHCHNAHSKLTCHILVQLVLYQCLMHDFNFLSYTQWASFFRFLPETYRYRFLIVYVRLN